ncbi:SHOCT domain-containing protein [Cellulomonas rhizosphaerae]|uniref:SHOCT domain-containing protein n=1 Tax=Cellulomonas rhizosphaerae TaxID=2293719 RepID=A0A413RLK2_9CELL|nr:SHOCT domain-containing protein [Cellulomonas rhizosphaerae]RHA40948.1 SHOCT domain-containing protein [Cellulomonas rhizosphaerae]
MPPLRRFGRPGLIGTAARTAVIVGTANATTGAMQRRQAGKQQAAAEQQAYEAQVQQQQYEEAARQAAAQQAAYAPPAVAAAPAQDDLMAKLTQLGQLHAQGILDDAEFAAAKAKILS